jgi:hypothetical protein
MDSKYIRLEIDILSAGLVSRCLTCKTRHPFSENRNTCVFAALLSHFSMYAKCCQLFFLYLNSSQSFFPRADTSFNSSRDVLTTSLSLSSFSELDFVFKELLTRLDLIKLSRSSPPYSLL